MDKNNANDRRSRSSRLQGRVDCKDSTKTASLHNTTRSTSERKLVTPIQRCLQRPLARRGASRPSPLKSQSLIEHAASDARHRPRSGALRVRWLEPRRQLAAHATTTAASASLKSSWRRSRRAIEEELRSWKGLGNSGRKPFVLRGTLQRLKPVTCSLGLKRLATRRQDVNLRRGCEDRRGECGRHPNQVLACVEISRSRLSRNERPSGRLRHPIAQHPSSEATTVPTRSGYSAC